MTQAQKEWYQKNKDKVKDAARKRKAALTEYVDFCKSQPCMDCGNKFPPQAMDFDHVRGTKIGDVSILIARGNLQILLDEIDKCDLVCSNCHRIRTAIRNGTLLLTEDGWIVIRRNGDPLQYWPDTLMENPYLKQ